MRTTRGDLDRPRESESSKGHAADQRRLSLLGRASVGTPGLPEEDMGQEEVSSLSLCLSIYLSTNNKLWTRFENKMRDIFLYIRVPRCS